MINKLRRKFILTSAAIITLVVSSVFIIVNLLNYYNIWNNGSASIDRVKNNYAVMNSIVNENKFDSNKISDTRGIIIAVIDNSKIANIYSKNLQLDQTVQEKLINVALENTDNSKKAYVESFEYEFTQIQGKDIMFLVDVDRELKVFNIFLFNSIIVVSTIIIIVVILLIVISKRVVSPLAENIKKQKQFITYASHELKTPLAIISSNTDLLSIENGQSKWLRNIQKQVDRLSELIASLIEFSRAEEKDTIQKTKFSLTELIEERIEDFEELAFFNSKTIISTIENNVYYNGEYESIFQVIDILLDNAIKYSDDESEIQVSLTANKGIPKLVVKNKSKHTSAGNLDVVFDRFYRDEHSRDGNTGYGLGLALAKLQLDKHNAKVKAYAVQDGEFIIEVNFR